MENKITITEIKGDMVGVGVAITKEYMAGVQTGINKPLSEIVGDFVKPILQTGKKVVRFWFAWELGNRAFYDNWTLFNYRGSVECQNQRTGKLIKLAV